MSLKLDQCSDIDERKIDRNNVVSLRYSKILFDKPIIEDPMCFISDLGFRFV